MQPVTEIPLPEGQVQDHPVEETDVSGYGPLNEDLPEQLIDAIKCALKEFTSQETYIRRREVLRDRRNRFYERGYQHILENWRTGSFQMVVPGMQAANAYGQTYQAPTYIGDYNIFQPYERIIQAVLTQNPPGIDFRPNDPSSVEDKEAAETAENYRHLFDRSNDVRQIQTQIVRMMCLSGRTVLWTRTEANGAKFGYNDDGSPKRTEVASVYGTLETKVPLLADSLEACPYLCIFSDPDIKQAKADYPKFASKIKANTPSLCENAYERAARVGVMQGAQSQGQLGDAYSHLVTKSHCWLRHSAFEGDKFEDPFEEAGPGDVDGEGKVLTVKEKLRQVFPNGIHVIFIGDTYVGSWDETMDDHLIIGFPYEGDGMFRLAIMDPMVIIQDTFNDGTNASRQIFDEGWPSTWVGADDTEFDAISDQTATPYAFRQMKLRASEKVADRVYREPNPELPATFVGFLEQLQGPLSQFVLACPPALFGNQMQDQKTASGYAQARSQAMGQQGIWFGVIQQMMARMYYHAALAASQNPDHAQEFVVPATDGQLATVRLDRLRKGKFGAYPDEDSSFPETTAQKRATLTGLVTMAGQSAFGSALFESPDNWETINQLMGLPELVVPQAQARTKQAFEIDILLQQSPVPPSPEEMQQAQIAHATQALQAQAGAAAPPPPMDPTAMLKPSVPVQPLDFHLFEFEKCREWLSSADRRKQEAEGNLEGIKNVELHAMEHWAAKDAFTLPPPMPAPAGPPPAKPKQPPPGVTPETTTAKAAPTM